MGLLSPLTVLSSSRWPWPGCDIFSLSKAWLTPSDQSGLPNAALVKYDFWKYCIFNEREIEDTVSIINVPRTALLYTLNWPGRKQSVWSRSWELTVEQESCCADCTASKQHSNKQHSKQRIKLASELSRQSHIYKQAKQHCTQIIRMFTRNGISNRTKY